MLPRTMLELLLPLVLALAVGADSVFGDVLFANSIQHSRQRILRDIRNDSCKVFNGITKQLVVFRLYYGPGADQFVQFTPFEADRIVNNLRWKRGAPVTIFIHDHLQSTNSQPTRSVLAAYFNSTNPTTTMFNVLAVEWSDISFLSYGLAVAAVPHVARHLLAGLERMEPAGAHVTQIVGHGLGAHVAGALGRLLAHPLEQIIGLDPSERLLYGLQRCERGLSASDALCVQAVHTDIGGEGAARPIATVDFFPNGGLRRQPSCYWWNVFNKYCSHNRALEMWKEVVLLKNTFVGRKCQTWEAFGVKKCQLPEERLQIGASCSGKKGSFYMWTNGNYPYGLGAAGATMGPKPNA